jgi:hypothetical protein
MATEELCELALKKYEERLSEIESVVGLGITAIDDEDAASSDLAVAVYVDKTLRSENPDDNAAIPSTLEVKRGRRKFRVPVRVIEQGLVWLERFDV